jgi:hypothetical protein
MFPVVAVDDRGIASLELLGDTGAPRTLGALAGGGSVSVSHGWRHDEGSRHIGHITGVAAPGSRIGVPVGW